jgi:Effector-associated domain 10/NACHT domain
MPSMRDNQDINAIFDRIANRNATDGDIQTLRQSVAIGGNFQGTTIVTGDDNILGDNNTVQIGKYNINIAEGSNINVGDTIYQGADAETIRAILLEVLTDKIVIDSTFSRLFGKSESSGVDWDWGMKLLKQKQLPEIRKRLTDTLGRDRILMDVSIEEQRNWVNRSPLAADRTLQVDGKDCGTLDTNKMLIETFGRDDIEGKLLILGAPGAGKTTALLSLAEQLVYGAISQPRTVIPVIFELSTWQNDNQSIESWLIDQLYDLHGGNRKSKLYEQWLERQVLLPLLDGLDELGLERQKKCTEKLNEFAEHYPQLVVCCRVKEFEAVDIKLRNLRGAVCLQSLSDSQIQNYLNSINRTEIWSAIQQDPALQILLKSSDTNIDFQNHPNRHKFLKIWLIIQQDLALQVLLNINIDRDPGLLRIPLFLKLAADIYNPDCNLLDKDDLIEKYTNEKLMFDSRDCERRKEIRRRQWSYKTINQEPRSAEVLKLLSWMARQLKHKNQIEFLIEEIQPGLLNKKQLKYYQILFVLIIGIMLGLFLFAIEGTISSFAVSLIVGALLLSEPYKFKYFAYCIDQKAWKNRAFNMILGIMVGIALSVVVALIECLSVSMTSGFKVLLFGTVYLSPTIGLILSVIGSFKNTPSYSTIKRYKPNQGIYNSCKCMIWIALCSYPLSVAIGTLGSFHSSLNNLIVHGKVSESLIISSAVLSLVFGFYSGGGIACVQHVTTRFILWQHRIVPWNLTQFLDYCVERKLLQVTGGRYRFLHRELLDHFAQSSR